jgi:hypothetical protein
MIRVAHSACERRLQGSIDSGIGWSTRFQKDWIPGLEGRHKGSRLRNDTTVQAWLHVQRIWLMET